MPNNKKNVLIIGGARNVVHCQGGTVNYELATSKVVCHEMGHCLGLIHTWQNNGDDGLSDTSNDYVQKNECVNPITCQFVSNCGISCNTQSNPTINMTNYMSYTVPNCMTVFSPLQVNLMRFTLNNTMSGVISTTETTPNMQLMMYDANINVNTVNFVSGGYHNLRTNLDQSRLISNVSWSANTPNLYPTGVKLVNADIVVNSGQSITVNITATNLCGSATRSPTFAASYGYSIYSNPVVTNSVQIKFDGADNADLLPQVILIYDIQTSRLEMIVDVISAKLNGQIANSTLNINVEKLQNGTKVIKFIYKNFDPASADSKFTTTDQIIIQK